MVLYPQLPGKGSIRIYESITLNPILHVPNLSCNLLSNSQLTKQSNCLAKFLPSHCVVQDLSSGKMIGSAKEREGLYYFDEANVRGQCPLTVCYFASSPRESGLLLWQNYWQYNQTKEKCNRQRNIITRKQRNQHIEN